MAINFPNSPSNGDTVTVNNITYVYNSSKGVWADNASGLPVIISDSAPTNPASGNIWFDSSDPALYIYYNDGSSAQWVQTNPSNRTANTQSLATTGKAIAMSLVFGG